MSRALAAGTRTPERLDHGFYYEDLELPVVVAPVTVVHEEWRFVVVRGAVVASSGYQAAGRRATLAKPGPGRPLEVIMVHRPSNVAWC